MKKVFIILILFGAIAVIGLVISTQSLSYQYEEVNLPSTFGEYFDMKLEAGEKAGVRPGNEVKLIQYADHTGIALLYIHGFSASRGEGEYVIDRLADSLQANTYYLRLPGHGTHLEDHANVSFSDYLDEVENSLRMVQLLGSRVVIIGTSMGGLLATYLAAAHPDLVDGLILCSPFYEFANPAGKAIRIPGMLSLIQWIDGPIRKPGSNPEWEKKKQPGYDNYWYTTQHYRSLKSLDDLRASVSKQNIFKKVKTPLLMLYYYVDETHQDQAASVEAMWDAFDSFSSRDKHKLAIENGDHVMTSQYVKTDKEAVLSAMLDFIRYRFSATEVNLPSKSTLN